MSRRTAAERQAVDTRVQGSAADLVKTAMVRVEEQLMLAGPFGSSSSPEDAEKKGRSTGTSPPLPAVPV